MNIVQRTIKIVLAALASILLAQVLNLQNPLAAGIVAILSVLDTRKASFNTAIARFLSTLLAFAIASAIFYFVGFNLLSFGSYLALYVPLAYRLRLQDGIAPCSVLVTHFMLAESIAWQWQLNGLLLMTIGAMMALVFHLWMPSYAKQLEQLKEEIESQMRDILKMMGDALTEKPDHFNEIHQGCRWLNHLLTQMNEIALTEYDNQLFRNSDYFLNYITMRREQIRIMQHMMDILPDIHLATESNAIMAQLFHLTADEFHELNTGTELLDNISQLYRIFRDSDLPKSRDEFESRASLFQMLTDFERFLEVKRNFFVHMDPSTYQNRFSPR